MWKQERVMWKHSKVTDRTRSEKKKWKKKVTDRTRSEKTQQRLQTERVVRGEMWKNARVGVKTPERLKKDRVGVNTQETW